MDRAEHYNNTYEFAWELNTADSIPNTGIWSCESENSHPRFANEIYHPTYKLTFDSEGSTYSDANGHPLRIPKAREYSTKYFIGWFKDDETDKLTSNSIITADGKYYPKYVSADEVTWHIEFLNEDGTSLYKQDVHHQEQPVYGGAIPTKQGNVKYSYTFAGWSPTIYAANKDQTYTATFNTSINQYQIEFKDFDESSLATLPFEYGKMPSLTTTPKRDSTEEWIYTFSRWTPDIASVTGPAIYTAVYDSIKVKYKVIFLNGAEEYEVQMVEYGSDAILPQAPQSSKAGYVFTGWKGDYTNITKSTILRAQFEEKVEVSSSSKEVPSSSSQTHVVSSSSEQIQPSSSAEENRSSSSVASSSSRETVSSSSTEAPSSSSELESSSSAIQSSCSSAEVSSSSVKASSSSVSLSSSSEKVSSSSIASSSSSETISSSSVEISSSSVKVSSSSAELSSSSEMSSSSAAPSSSSAEATSSSSVMESSSSEENTPLITGISKTFTVSVVDHGILITNARIGSTFALFDMQGRTLSQGKINSGSHLIEVPQKGKYIIWAEGKAVTATIK